MVKSQLQNKQDCNCNKKKDTCVPIIPTKLNCNLGTLKKKKDTTPFKRKIKQCSQNRPNYVGHCILCIFPVAFYHGYCCQGTLDALIIYVCLSHPHWSQYFSFDAPRTVTEIKIRNGPHYYTNTYKAEGVTPMGHRVVPGSIDALALGPPALCHRVKARTSAEYPL